MFIKILIVIAYLVAPAFVLRLCHVSKVAGKIGSVLICYAIGLIIGSTGILDDYKNIPDILTTITIPLALPMLLFEVNVRLWKQMAKKAFLSMVLAVSGLVAIVFVAFFAFRNYIPETWKLGGLLIGLYTGGTPNLASIQTALQLDKGLYIGIHSIDVMIGAVYILFLVSFAKRLLDKILIPTVHVSKEIDNQSKKIKKTLPLKAWLCQVSILNTLKTLGVGLLVALAGGGLGFLVKDPTFQMAAIILLITTFGIAAANIKAVKQIKGSYDVGMYCILVFSLAVASLANFETIASLSGYLIAFVTVVMFGSFALHLILCKIFKIDTDIMMVTSAALICSPPFVPVVVGAINNRDVMVSGITVGVVGYALGNYLGIGMAYLLRLL
ncbi:MAG: DUF819 family protein [Paludibacteraceae bacterium]|jgi:uncharacterized membrane protein|nr:DUF819 family protein [Paludibacteraceae bacterium]MDI9537715.1 DUF819 family protein [Bacteroidota bacterium]NCA78668.1 DUF819 family protein [Sphingobacteriia bacterium]OQC34838.1 MAG: hypothetical protein BWX65_00052 [Bacteroidetes bacterium ADurb.Bin057]MBP9039906.1 DUF819 family protein [Paludibacteraceae bacterium]